MDVTATFGALGQGYAALSLAPATQGFARGPGVLSGLALIDTVAGIVGVERLSGQLAKYAVKLALRGDGASEDAARAMVDLMRARVPVDSGTLLNGISWRKEGRVITVEASAVRGDADYARWVEFGHHAGGSGHADADFFTREDHSALRTRTAASTETDVPPDPFFWDSVREGLGSLRERLGDAAATARREEGL